MEPYCHKVFCKTTENYCYNTYFVALDGTKCSQDGVSIFGSFKFEVYCLYDFEGLCIRSMYKYNAGRSSVLKFSLLERRYLLGS